MVDYSCELMEGTLLGAPEEVVEGLGRVHGFVSGIMDGGILCWDWKIERRVRGKGWLGEIV